MKKIDKQKEIYDFLSTIKNDDSAFVLYYFKKTQLLRNRFPEITSFDEFVATFKKRIGQKRKDELQKLYEKEEFRQSVVNADGYVMNSKVPTALGVEKEVYKKFEKTDYFPNPVGMETFHKWGKTLQTPYFNYDDIIFFKENKLEAVLKILKLGKENDRESEVKKEGAKLAKLFDLKNYQDTFPLAREIKRNIHIISGPTNSGKTYEAIEALKTAHSGIYLAPLRLMAMEIFDKLNAAGIPCSLKTGDDEVIVPGARHIASTVECLDLSAHYEVAVIDEFQMLRDQERGWAWTQAILGVVANNVYLIGNSSGVDIIKKILSKTKDVVKLTEKSRHSQLKIIDSPVKVSEIQSGDAVIVFSRKGVIEWAEYLRDKGKSVSLIYGALAPEVRRKQAQMFLDGETDILVSTDAIGMGLNLPIKRVLFTTMEKYNGSSMDYLTSTEIKQIGGRAGRYKEDGFIGVIKGGHSIDTYYNYYGEVVRKQDRSNYYLKILKDSLVENDIPILNVDVSPNNFHLREISKALNTNSILEVLDCFKYVANDELFYPRVINGAEDFVKICGKKFLSLELELQYHLINTPVEDKNNILQRVAPIIQKTFFQKRKSVLNNWINVNSSFSQAIEVEIKMLTALIHISKQTDLIDMSSTNSLRKDMSDKIINELLYKFRQSAELKKLYAEKQQELALNREKKAERKKRQKELFESEYKRLKVKRDSLIHALKLSLSENERSELKKQKNKISKEMKKMKFKMPNLANL